MHRTRVAECKCTAHRGGFTLLELLVSIGIISMLAVLLLPVVPMARRHARDTKCKSNLSQIWKTVNIYANNHKDTLFSNLDTPLRISNVAYSNGRPTGFGCLYPLFVKEYVIFFCPSDPVRGPEWANGWDNWDTEDGEVQISYGYRGAQGFVKDPALLAAIALDPAKAPPVTLATIDAHPKKVFAAEFYEPFLVPARVNHPMHINLIRCWGQVEHKNVTPSFGPNPEDFDLALELLESN
ncbi:MAG TPA: type II secretion system protein [Planctomycetota bacterium]|nr:type II secretion system protein [Planctomycetota bacterium]HRR82113.1 type II secretion system protein [Planctomycetota bacterium]HRT92892.1 type II secretion system protein [Planctomycetota bacterium]